MLLSDVFVDRKALMPKSGTLDRFDSALLEQMQIDNLVATRRLAEWVGLSESAVLRGLRREGVIAADCPSCIPPFQDCR